MRTTPSNPSVKARGGSASMEGYYAPKAAEASGKEEGGAMARGTTKSLKAAATAAAVGPYGLFAGYSAEGKADQEEAASAVGRAFAMSALATVMAHKAMEAAQQAAVLAAAAAKQADAEKQAKEANQAKEEVVVDEEQEAAASTDAYATDSDDEADGMSAMKYIMTYKELPPFEVELIMGRPVQCTPFADTEEYKALIADPSTTQEDIDVASDKHKEHLNTRIQFHDYVRSDYEAKGYVAVTNEYIARRAHMEEFSRKLWENAAFSDSDSEDDIGEGANCLN